MNDGIVQGQTYGQDNNESTSPLDSKTVGKAVCDDPFFCLGVGYMVCMLGTVWW